MLRESSLPESSRLKMAIQWVDELWGKMVQIWELVVNQKKCKIG